MGYFPLNLVLALVWMLLTGGFTLGNLLVGFAVGYAGLVVARPFVGSGRYVRSVQGSSKLVAVFLYELVYANILLARDILRPVPPFRPGFLAFDVRDLTPVQTVLLANMISLTPGTLTVDTDDVGETLYVHGLYAEDPERIRRGLRSFSDLIRGASGREPLSRQEDHR
jgi:multicomponent Na+:H+ antiporter subunit E